uniref:Minor tail protein n=1 Tax=Pectobacterium phage Sabo TaxID=3158141 RepID=A0AB39ABZ6_9CAUD
MAIVDEAIKPDPSGKILLVEFDGSAFGADILRFHYAPIPHTPEEIIAAGDDVSKLTPKSIWWNGLEFGLWPFKIEDVEITTEQPTDPNLTVSNLNGTIGSMCQAFEDMVGAKVTIVTTYTRFLDAVNFPNGNPNASPSEASVQLFFVDSKSFLDGEVATFVLSSPATYQDRTIPTRIISAYCTWAARGQYRKSPCNYDGTLYFDIKGNPVSDPALDKCGGCLQDCKMRFGSTTALPFGGFPAAQLIRN